jgi:hypothetical protein
MQKEFSHTVFYKCFAELKQKATIALAVFIKVCCIDSCTAISFIVTTTLKACHIKREKRQKVFKNMATKG